MNEEMTIMQPADGNKFYMCTVLIEGESDSGKPKNYKEIHLVESPTPTGAETKISEQMSGTMFPWRITNMSESKIQFVY